MRAKQSRAGYIDLLRGFCIILMVMGHVGFGVVFDKWIHAFHVPIWFIISGLFLNPSQPTRYYIIKKVKALLIPYFIFGLLYEILWSLFSRSQWIGIIFPNSIEIPLNGALWFLPALLFSEIISFVLMKFFSKKISYICIAMIALIGSQGVVSLPFSLDSAFVGIGLITIGRILKEHARILTDINIGKAAILLVVGSFIAMVNGYVNMRINVYGFPVLFWVNIIIFFISTLNICRWLDKIIDLKAIKNIGSNSLLYLCVNQSLLYCLNLVITSEKMIFSLAWNVMEVFAILVICYFLNKFILRSPLKIILGKQ